MNNTKEITRGGEFIVKETKCENIFTTEDFSEEQKMMRDAVKEFADKEIWSKKDEFEKKNYQLTVDVMKKAGDLGFLGVGAPVGLLIRLLGSTFVTFTGGSVTLPVFLSIVPVKGFNCCFFFLGPDFDPPANLSPVS